MKKSTVIATCLVDLNIADRLEDAEEFVKLTFRREFPEDNFPYWNQEIHDTSAEILIRYAVEVKHLDVPQLIRDLDVIR